jgi:uncharacterized protein (TIGR02145 family)
MSVNAVGASVARPLPFQTKESFFYNNISHSLKEGCMNLRAWLVQGRAVLLASVLAAGMACWLFGCGGDDGGNGNNPGNNGGGSAEYVTLGGKKWMKKNLNVQTAESWCYDNEPANCAKYGRLYTWSVAKSACPSGWHLPSNAEWDALVEAAGGSSVAGSRLKSTSGWYDNGNGTDAYGFSALPGGARASDGGFDGAGYIGAWWTDTEYDADAARSLYMAYHDEDDNVDSNIGCKECGFSVRCVGD